MWRAGTMFVAAVLFLPGCGGDFVPAVIDGDMVSRVGSYADSPYQAAAHVAQVRFYRAMGAAYSLAERETDNVAARDLFSGLRKGWKGFGYAQAGQGGYFYLPGYTDRAMSDALGTLPAGTCKEVTRQIADAYGALRDSLKYGTRDKHVEAARGAGVLEADWRRRNLNDC